MNTGINNDWSEALLGELGSTYNGLTGKSKEDFGTGKPFITYMNVFSDNRIRLNNFGQVRILENEFQNKVSYGDIFFTTSSETVDEVGMSSVLLDDVGEAYLNSFCFGFRLHDFKRLKPEYARYLLRSDEARKTISVLAQGSTRFNLSKTALLKRLKLLLPPIHEQEKIASILSKVDEKIDVIEEQIKVTEELKKALMQQLLTKGIGHTKFKDSSLGEIPDSWEVVKSNELFELIHGYQFRDYDFTDEGLPIIKIGSIKATGSIDLTSCSYFDKAREKEFEGIRIFNGDVLMALTGATLGKSCLVHELSAPAYQNYRVGKFEPFDVGKLSKVYLYFLIGSPIVLEQIFAKVNSGAQGNVGKSDFDKLKIPLPPIKEQDKIADILFAIDEKRKVLAQKKEGFIELKTGLMQQLLTGKMRVKLN